MQGFIFGLLLVLGGGAVMYFSRSIEQAFGRSARAEKNLGSTRAMYVLFGFVLVIIGVLMRFGLSASNPADIDSGFGAS